MAEEYISLDVCRLCLLKAPDGSPIFFCDEEGNLSDLPEIVKRCVDVEVNADDGYSQLICRRCKKLLMLFNKFKETCQDSQQRLRRLNRRKQVMELRKMPEDMVVEEESRIIFDDLACNERLRPNSPEEKEGEVSCDFDDAVKPLAIWTVSQDGQFRANTTSVKDEIIVSELLDEISEAEDTPEEMVVDDEELEAGVKSNHLEHHNYCSTSESIKEVEDVKETTIAEEEEWIQEANDDRTVLLKSLKVPPSPRTILPKTSSNNTDNEKDIEIEHSTMRIMDQGFLKTTQGLMRIHKPDAEFKTRILISQNSKQVHRIPELQAEPINGRNQGDPVVKVSKTLQRLDEERALQSRRRSLLKGLTKGYKTLSVSKVDDSVKIVRDGSGKSNICLLKIKNRTSPLAPEKTFR